MDPPNSEQPQAAAAAEEASAAPPVYAKKQRRGEQELIQAADEVMRGATFQDISQKHNIPVSTIRFYMTRKGYLTWQEYTVPRWFQWREDGALLEAAQEVDQGTLFVDAAKKYELPVTVIRSYMKHKGMLEGSKVEKPTTFEPETTKPGEEFFVFRNKVPEGSNVYYRQWEEYDLVALFEYMAEYNVNIDVEQYDDLVDKVLKFQENKMK